MTPDNRPYALPFLRRACSSGDLAPPLALALALAIGQGLTRQNIRIAYARGVGTLVVWALCNCIYIYMY